MRSGAIMLYFVTKIKNDLDDDTISVSSRCAQAPNFDFDGKLALPRIAVKQYVSSLKLLETPKAPHPEKVTKVGNNRGDDPCQKLKVVTMDNQQPRL